MLRDGRILAASFGAGRVWAIEPDGTSHVLASGIGGANCIAETRNGRVLVSASLTGQILDITHETPVEFASGFLFPNGLALGRSGGQRFLYVVETLTNRVSRLPLAGDDTPGSAELYATGLPLADGLAFDAAGNLWVVGTGTRVRETAPQPKRFCSSGTVVAPARASRSAREGSSRSSGVKRIMYLRATWYDSDFTST